MKTICQNESLSLHITAHFTPLTPHICFSQHQGCKDPIYPSEFLLKKSWLYPSPQLQNCIPQCSSPPFSTTKIRLKYKKLFKIWLNWEVTHSSHRTRSKNVKGESHTSSRGEKNPNECNQNIKSNTWQRCTVSQLNDSSPLLQKHLLSLQKEMGNNYLTLTEFMELSEILCKVLLQNLTLFNQLFWFSSTGHRVCLGEQMARVELFIFFTNLLRAFTFQLPEGVKEINLEYILGAILQPHPYKLCAIPR